MDLERATLVAKRWWRVIATGVLAGVIMASLSLFSVGYTKGAKPGLSFKRRSHTTYQTTLNLLIDVPGFGAGRTDVSMDKPSRMAPTFAYIAMSDDVMKRVTKELGPLGKTTKVVVAPVQDSPVLQITVEGPDPDWVRRVATKVGAATVEYITGQQNSNSVPGALRLEMAPLGTPSKPLALKSRDVEIAAILFLMPILLSFVIAAAADNITNRSVDQVGDSSTDSSSQEAVIEPASAVRQRATPAKRKRPTPQGGKAHP